MRVYPIQSLVAAALLGFLAFAFAGPEAGTSRPVSQFACAAQAGCGQSP